VVAERLGLTRAAVSQILRGMPLEPGNVVGTARFRSIHRDFYKGIYVPAKSGVAVSIRFRPRENAGYGYTDFWREYGRILDYTGQGPPPADQDWNRFNAGLRNAAENTQSVHTFEELEGGSPRTYKYWGQWAVASWYEALDAVNHRKVIRFIIEVPD
jgi:hypothetical protein